MVDERRDDAPRELGPRERMVRSAVVLLAQRGVAGASLSAVLERSGAPRGSIYHHFPGGKDELVVAAVEAAGDDAVALLDALDGLPAAQVVDGFLAMWRALLVGARFTTGCAVLAVAVAGDDATQVDRAAATFRRWTQRLAELLEHGGIAAGESGPLAVTVVAASEGAVALSRAERDLAPFEGVAVELRRLVEAHVTR